MDIERAATMLASAGSSTRLRVLVLLADHADGLAAGDIGRRLDVLQNTMSGHLKALSAAGLVDVRRHGRSLVYLLSTPAVEELAKILAAIASPIDDRAGPADG